MSWIKALFAGAAGAAGFSAATQLEASDATKGIISLISRRPEGSANADVGQLQKQMEQLQHMLLRSYTDRQPQAVIVTTNSNDKRGWVGIIVPVALATGTVYVYIRFVKGWRLTDFMYVTRSSLQSLKSNMADGLGKMREHIEKTTKDVLVQMGVVTQNQKELMDQQEELKAQQTAMDGTLKGVAVDMEGVRDEVGQVNQQMGLLAHGIEQANRNIYLLCAAVADVAKRTGINGRSTQALDSMVQSAVPQLLTGSAAGVRVQGLECVLEEVASSSSGASRGHSTGQAPLTTALSSPQPSTSSRALGWDGGHALPAPLSDTGVDSAARARPEARSSGVFASGLSMFTDVLSNSRSRKGGDGFPTA